MRGMTPEETAEHLVAAARDLGFHRVGVVPVEPARRHDVYREWLEAGHDGLMTYLRRPETVDARRDPRGVMPEARTVVVVALSYGSEDLVPLTRKGHGLVARYARGRDYHEVMKERLYELADRIAAFTSVPVSARPCVDSAPVLERDLAESSGIGFVAKNTMLIAPGLGSYVLLGELLLGIDVAPVRGNDDRKRCGSCRACLDACPTGAFVDAYVLDARRCISYLTIELQGFVPRALRPLIGTRVFGCDVCQEVCPFNAPYHREGATPRTPADAELAPTVTSLDLIELLTITSSGYRRLVKHSAMRRASRNQLKRNACIALGNAGDPGAASALEAALEDRAPVVRGHAAWALGQLGQTSALVRRLDKETNADVRAEITAALGAGQSPAAAPG